MKVYVLSRGEYSDWTIEGIFSSLEGLEAGKARILNGEDRGVMYFNDPDEYVLDEILSLEYGPRWSASVECKSGEIYNVGELGRALRHPSACTVEVIRARYRQGEDSNAPAIYVTSPISQEHAIKVATEQRQAWLREQVSIPNASSPR